MILLFREAKFRGPKFSGLPERVHWMVQQNKCVDVTKLLTLLRCAALLPE